jgi:hypothetical protein
LIQATLAPQEAADLLFYLMNVVSTVSARMPDRIGPHGVLYRDKGKTPAFFDAAQIEALLALHRSELNEGNLPDRRDADEIDFDE